MKWEFETIVVWRRYDNRVRDYRWTSPGPRGEVSGWQEILEMESRNGWELVAAGVEGYQEGNTSTEATGYRLFFKRPV